MTPTPRAGIMDLRPYVGGDAKLPGIEKPYQLAANESPLGPSPKAREAYLAAAGSLERYPSGGSGELREALAELYGLNPDNIACGAGSDDLLSVLGRAYLNPGDEVLYPEHGFLMYKLIAQTCCAVPVEAPEKDLRTDVDALLAKVTKRTKIVFLANPNNPTGTYIPVDEVKRLRAGLPDHVLLVLDGAYAEYVRANDYEAGIELVATNDNVVMTRTFSKIYGLAALRVGWCYGPADIIGVVNRMRFPFNVCAAGQKAAEAAVKDIAWTEQARVHNDTWLPKLRDGIMEIGFDVTPSVGNFLLIHFPDTPGKTAKDAEAFLRGNGIILRNVASYHLPHCLRFTIGTDEANDAVLTALNKFASA